MLEKIIIVFVNLFCSNFIVDIILYMLNFGSDNKARWLLPLGIRHLVSYRCSSALVDNYKPPLYPKEY